MTPDGTDSAGSLPHPRCGGDSQKPGPGSECIEMVPARRSLLTPASRTLRVGPEGHFDLLRSTPRKRLGILVWFSRGR